MSDILNSAISDSTILNNKKLHLFIVTQLDDGSHLQFYHLGFQPFRTKKLHSLIVTQLDDGSHLEVGHVGFSTLPSWIQTPCYLLSDSLKKHSHSTLSLTQTNSIWLKLIHSHSTWWWLPSWILPSWILPSSIQPLWTKKTSLIHFHSTWWWQPSSILPPWIQPFCTK